MKISYNWLKDYVKTTLDPHELDDLLTFSGLEIEGVDKVETIKGGLEHVVIAQVLTCEPHPDSDHLHLTTVDVGAPEPLHIVCGAPNVAVGQKVVCAQIGTKIWTSDTEFHEIKKGKLRGAVSEGMLCAADELQLGADHDGIMVLPPDAPVGMPARDYFNVKDDILDDTHTWKPENAEKCDSMKANYYLYNNSYISDTSSLELYITNTYNINGKGNIECALNNLDINDDTLQFIFQLSGVESVKYSVNGSSEYSILSVYIN